MTEFRILVTGSRDWTNLDTIRRVLSRYTQNQLLPVVVVHGGAQGADALANRVATGFIPLGWDIEPHPANWLRYGRRAGPIRNKHMVSLGADVCLAFIRNNSRGATMCADLAEQAGIPTFIYRED